MYVAIARNAASASPVLAAFTALRRGEICGLKWRDLDFAKGTLRVAQQVQNIGGKLVLQHTHITHQLRAGVPVHIVSARAGHANANITLGTYAHLLGSDDAAPPIKRR
jgi:integrase